LFLVTGKLLLSGALLAMLQGQMQQTPIHGAGGQVPGEYCPARRGLNESKIKAYDDRAKENYLYLNKHTNSVIKWQFQ
jgi:hypothetical protein